jgi:hypothetical protein
MKKETALNIVRNILLLIEKHHQKHKHHANSCEFLSTKYIELRLALISDTEALTELIEWNKWFAPRIIYDGIGNKDILIEIEKLDILLNDKAT